MLIIFPVVDNFFVQNTASVVPLPADGDACNLDGVLYIFELCSLPAKNHAVSCDSCRLAPCAYAL